MCTSLENHKKLRQWKQTVERINLTSCHSGTDACLSSICIFQAKVSYPFTSLKKPVRDGRKEKMKKANRAMNLTQRQEIRCIRILPRCDLSRSISLYLKCKVLVTKWIEPKQPSLNNSNPDKLITIYLSTIINNDIVFKNSNTHLN